MDDTPKHYQKGKRRTRKTVIKYMKRQALTILAREIEQLMDASYDRKLNRDEGLALRAYLPILNELEELDKIKTLENPDETEYEEESDDV